jgi:hypothetical protein
MKSTPAAIATAAPITPAQPQRAAHSHTQIAQKAYEIWLAQGQQAGCDQKHWFEAELQLGSPRAELRAERN